MQIIVDDWYEFIILAATILGSLFILYLIIKLIITSNRKIKGYGLEIGGDMQQEYSKSVIEIKDILKNMEIERSKSKEEIRVANIAIQKMIKSLACTSDAILEALQINKIGNGNLEKARKSLAKCYETQDNYLVNQL